MECQFRPLLPGWIQTASLGVKAAPPLAVVIKDKAERDGCLLWRKATAQGAPVVPGARSPPDSSWPGCPVSGTFPEPAEASLSSLELFPYQ